MLAYCDVIATFDWTGRSDAEFNLRHDWNSLLDTDTEPITNRTADRWPAADVLVEYLRDFAQEQEHARKMNIFLQGKRRGIYSRKNSLIEGD